MDEPKDVMKQLLIKPEKCIGCGVCLKHCPVSAIENNASGEVMAGKKLPWKIIDPSKCIKCGACESSCKFKAIIRK